MTVLVAYASVHGSTAEIAERIGGRFVKQGCEVEVVPFDDVGDPAKYDAFVLGSAVHDQRWLPAALRFADENREVLASRPTWLFSVGMPAAIGWPFRKAAMLEEPKIGGELRNMVSARGHRLFSGVVRRDHFPAFQARMAFRLMGCRYGDYRDWAQIEKWAGEIAHELAQGRTTGPCDPVRVTFDPSCH